MTATTRTYASHRNCTHAATPAGRKACRARNANRVEVTVVRHSGNVALVRLANGTFVYKLAA